MKTLPLALGALLVFLGVGLAAPAGLAVEGDLVYPRKSIEGGTPPSIFRHWVHRIRYRCYACHPGLYKIDGEIGKTTMAEIREGKSCGTCHNDKIAWGVSFESCGRCHAERK